jgi:hypothetical protein
MSCKEAFEYLSVYVPGTGARQDLAVSRSFDRAARALGARAPSYFRRASRR